MKGAATAAKAPNLSEDGAEIKSPTDRLGWLLALQQGAGDRKAWYEEWPHRQPNHDWTHVHAWNATVCGPADRALRLFFALKMKGNATASTILDMLAEIDEAEHGNAVFEETAAGWRSAA